MRLVEEVGFDSAFTVRLLAAAGTEAAAMPDQISEEVKRERIERLVEVTQRLAHTRNLERVGRVEDVLVEGPSRTDPARLRGRSRHNKAVFSGLAQPGEYVRIEISAATESRTLAGEESRCSLAPRRTERGRRVMTPGLVIFDCDGVLVDSEDLDARADRRDLRGRRHAEADRRA